jgi:hypothetical protein
MEMMGMQGWKCGDGVMQRMMVRPTSILARSKCWVMAGYRPCLGPASDQSMNVGWLTGGPGVAQGGGARETRVTGGQAEALRPRLA